MKKILIALLLCSLVLLPIVLSNDNAELPAKGEWSDIFGTFGNLGYYFMTFINVMMFAIKVIWFAISVGVFYLLIYFLMILLPLRLYPTFLQYYNLMKRIFSL